eukprot:3797170-Rhodomonas_salina.1
MAVRKQRQVPLDLGPVALPGPLRLCPPRHPLPPTQHASQQHCCQPSKIPFDSSSPRCKLSQGKHTASESEEGDRDDAGDVGSAEEVQEVGLVGVDVEDAGEEQQRQPRRLLLPPHPAASTPQRHTAPNVNLPTLTSAPPQWAVSPDSTADNAAPPPSLTPHLPLYLLPFLHPSSFPHLTHLPFNLSRTWSADAVTRGARSPGDAAEADDAAADDTNGRAARRTRMVILWTRASCARTA